MSAFLHDVGTWPIVVVCIVVALVVPASAARQLTPGVLREHFALITPGRVIASAVLLLVVLGVKAAAIALAAMAHPVFWAFEATIASGAAVVILYLVRYREAARSCAGEQLAHPAEHRPG